MSLYRYPTPEEFAEFSKVKNFVTVEDQIERLKLSVTPQGIEQISNCIHTIINSGSSPLQSMISCWCAAFFFGLYLSQWMEIKKLEALYGETNATNTKQNSGI